jgi:hypothetical protein
MIVMAVSVSTPALPNLELEQNTVFKMQCPVLERMKGFRSRLFQNKKALLSFSKRSNM